MSTTVIDKEYLRKLIDEKIDNYALAKKQSQIIDGFLGYKISENELLLEKNSNSDQVFWIGLDPDVLQTPYSEILEMLTFSMIGENDKVVDLGSAYGRMGIVMGLYFPLSHFVGYEFIVERVNEGNLIFDKCGFKNSIQKQTDLASDSFEMPNSDLYFIYDFGSKKDVYAVLEKLRIIAKNKRIKVIARGGGVRNWIMQDFPWLSQFNDYERHEHWTLFRT